MQCPAVLHAFLFLAAIDSQRLTSGLRRSRDITQDQVCRRSPHYICPNGQCVPVANARCDGVTQCKDGSDEINCPSSGCILPQQPFGGSFQIRLCAGNSCDIVSGRAVPSGTFLIYRCNDDYTLRGNNISVCYMNTWYLSPSCVKTCPVLTPDGVDISCRYNGEIVPCEPTIFPGTKATLACKHSYKIPVGNDPVYRELTCLDEGTWDRPVFHCISECGTAIAHGRPMIINGSQAKLGGYPWHVGVYEIISSDNLEQICAGTLISPDLVISAAHCFWDDSFMTVKNVSRFAIAAGKYYRPYMSPQDPYVQKSRVENIDVEPGYLGFRGHYANDIALIRVKTPFTLNMLIRPICMDWDNRHEDQQFRFGVVGKVGQVKESLDVMYEAVGWGRTASGNFSVELQEIDLPYIPRQNCITTVPDDFVGFVTTDKFCGGYLNGTSLCDGDSGGGVFFKFDGLWFLRGIVSVGPVSNNICDKNFYTAFTNVGVFLKWIRTVYFRSGNFDDGGNLTINYAVRVAPIGGTVTTTLSSSCYLPKQPEHGSFELGSCTGQCNNAAGSRIPNNSSLIYRCNEGYTLIGNNITVCFNNEWDPSPTCSRNYCPALRSTSVDFDCKYHGKNVSCEFEILPMTTATQTCKDSYKFIFPTYREITCLQDGAWDRPVIDCDFVCGTSLPENFQLIVDGSLVPRHRFPWHIDIYDKFYSLSSVYAVGTLISAELVLADIHWNSNDTTGLTTAGRWGIVAGQFGKGYNNYNTEPYAQKSEVTDVHIMIAPINVLFLPILPGIIIFRLKNRFAITPLVSPICTYWGQIRGFNFTGTDIQLLETDYSLPVCLSNVPKECVAQEHYFCKYYDLWYLSGVGAVQSTNWYSCSDGIKTYRLIKPIKYD